MAENATNASVCVNLTPDEDVAETCKFWIQGVALSAVGAVGAVGNLVRSVLINPPVIVTK